MKPLTGYFRDGFCGTDQRDAGTHVVFSVVSQDFLEYSLSRENDLMTPIPCWNFPELQQGSKWCLCISRWLQAEKAGKVPRIILEATHESALKYTTIELLKSYEYHTE